MSCLRFEKAQKFLKIPLGILLTSKVNFPVVTVGEIYEDDFNYKIVMDFLTSFLTTVRLHSLTNLLAELSKNCVILLLNYQLLLSLRHTKENAY